jgi:ABC-type branched-subunit amino acid transport system ATPase component
VALLEVEDLHAVEQNLRLGAYIRPGSATLEGESIASIEIFPMLCEARGKRAADLSGGQQRMLEMGRALLLGPRLMLLDEPTLGLAPLVFKEIFRIIDGLRRRGQTILMVEQNAAQALMISDYAYVLELGLNRFEGSGRGDPYRRSDPTPVPRALSIEHRRDKGPLDATARLGRSPPREPAATARTR